MTDDTRLTTDEWPPILTAKAQIRAVSDRLKWVGFRPGAPLHRATPEFTLAGLKQALFAAQPDGLEAELRFTTTVDHEEIRMLAAVIRRVGHTGEMTVAYDLFPRGVHWEYWMVEGLLLERDPDPDPDQPSPYTVVYADAYVDDVDFDRLYPNRVPMIPDDLFLQVIAMVACDADGHMEGAVVQRPPSPADQILQVPPR